MKTSSRNINYLEKIVVQMRDLASGVIEYPEPDFKLDLKSRAEDSTYQFKHMHRMSTLQREHFVRSNQIKLIYLIEGYILLCKDKNVLGPYLFARTILELCAFLNNVCGRLKKIKERKESDWKPKGIEFFSLLVRARYGTSYSKLNKQLVEMGLPKKILKPLNIMHSLSVLYENPEAKSLDGKYDMLCDFVHHNLSSQVSSSSGFRTGSVSHSSEGAMLLTMQDGPITRYEYPVVAKAEKAIEQTLDLVIDAVIICLTCFKTTPHTPYSETQLLEFTGSKSGFSCFPGYSNN